MLLSGEVLPWYFDFSCCKDVYSSSFVIYIIAVKTFSGLL